MTIAKALILGAAAAVIGLTATPSPAKAQCYGWGCNPYGARSYYRPPAAYRYAIAPYEAQSYFPNLAVYGDASNRYFYGYATGYRSAYGCLWLDRNCPSW